MKSARSLFKKEISLVLAGLMAVSFPARADWVPVENVPGAGYQAVITAEKAQERELRAEQESAVEPISETNGFSSLTLTRVEDGAVAAYSAVGRNDSLRMTLAEKAGVRDLYDEVVMFANALFEGKKSDHLSSTSRKSSILSEQETPRFSSIERRFKILEAADSSAPDGEKDENVFLISGGQQENARNQEGREQRRRLLSKPDQTESSLSDLTKPQKRFLPGVVQNSEMPENLSQKIPSKTSRGESEEEANGVKMPKIAAESLKKTVIRRFMTLLEKFQLSLSPQELDKKSESAAPEEVPAAGADPGIDQGQRTSHLWIASVFGGATEFLRVSAKQLRDWLYEVEAFDQGRLSFKVRNLRYAMDYLLTHNDKKADAVREDGYRVVDSVDLDSEMAALHVLANPPRVHPFVRHVLFEPQAASDKLKRYWLDVEKLKALYAQAGTTDENGNVYTIRYKGKILNNPYRPMPNDMGGQYQLVVAE